MKTQETKPKKKPRGKPFQKGNNANPGGRPKIPPELKAMAQAAAPRALQIALELMDSADSEQVRLAAAREVMDRGYGKPAQSVDVTSDGDKIQPVQIIRVHAIEEQDK